MGVGPNRWSSRKALDAIVGIEAGVIGGAAMLALLMLVAPVLGDSWWTYPNLFASHYYGRAPVQYGAGVVTLSGIGLQIFWAGVVGALSGLVSPRGRHGVLFAMLWFLACYFVFWKKYAPGVGIYGSAALLFASFLLYGSVLRLQRSLLEGARPAQDHADPPMLAPDAEPAAQLAPQQEITSDGEFR